MDVTVDFNSLHTDICGLAWKFKLIASKQAEMSIWFQKTIKEKTESVTNTFKIFLLKIKLNDGKRLESFKTLK